MRRVHVLCFAAAGAFLGTTNIIRANPIPAPHPQITEVLFNVPNDSRGDANKDGERHAAGDEFVEIANPHGSPINLKGYVIFNRRASFAGGTGKGVRFVFPDVVLAPHSVAVVFNGCESRFSEPIGTEVSAPKAVNPNFAQALAFTMNVKSKGTAFANTGDWVALAAPDGTILDVVSWGEPDPPPPTGALRHQEVDKNSKGSVQRLGPEDELEAHPEINGEPHSPGLIPTRTKAAGPRKSPSSR